MYLNVLIFILLFGFLQALIVVAALLTGKKAQASHYFLSAYMAVLIFQLFFKVLNKMWLMETFVQGYVLSYFLPFLYGPLLWLFSKSYLQNNYKWKRIDILHFVPFMIYLFFFWFTNPENHANRPGAIDFILRAPVRLAGEICSLIVYHLAVFKLLNEVSKEKGKADLFSLKKSFLKKFSVASFFITFCIAVVLFFLFMNFPNYQDVRWSFVLLTIFVYWLSYQGFKSPELFKVIQGNSDAKNSDYRIHLVAHRPRVKYSNSRLKEEEIQRILSGLTKAMDEDKLYLDPDLDIDKLTKILSCQKHHLSQVLNNNLQKSFNEYINEKRLAQVKLLLSNPQFNHLKIAGIAYDAGFNSLSSFNEIFKKSEGITPSRFKSMAQQQQQLIKRV